MVYGYMLMLEIKQNVNVPLMSSTPPVSLQLCLDKYSQKLANLSLAVKLN